MLEVGSVNPDMIKIVHTPAQELKKSFSEIKQKSMIMELSSN